MFIVGLTGGIGSGKSTVAELFAKKGISIIDADKIARDLTQPGQAAFTAIIAHFGPSVLNSDGTTLNRTQLRKIIFDDPAEKKWLENLLHPLIRDEMKQLAQKAKSPYCIAMIPLLLETPKNPMINRILVVDVPEEIQIRRIQTRDHLSRNEIIAALENQINRTDRLALADDIIQNEGTIEDLIPAVEKLHALYLTYYP